MRRVCNAKLKAQLLLSTASSSLQVLFDELQWLCYCLTRSPSSPVHHTATALMSELFINWLLHFCATTHQTPVQKQAANCSDPKANRQPKITVLQGQGNQLKEINFSRNSNHPTYQSASSYYR